MRRKAVSADGKFRGKRENTNDLCTLLCESWLFPESLIASAREEMYSAVEKAGYQHIEMAPEETHYGDVVVMGVDHTVTDGL